MSEYIHPSTFITELEQQNNLLQSARDLLRAKQQGVELNPYFKSLSDALQAYKDSEFDDWCLEVDRTCMQLLERNRANSLLEEHGFEWDYDTYFNQGLTINQAATILQQHLIASC